MSSQFDTLSATFQDWLTAVDAELADRLQTRDSYPFQLHQWWDLWDACVDPASAVTAAGIFRPDWTRPIPTHLAYYPTYGYAHLKPSESEAAQ